MKGPGREFGTVLKGFESGRNNNDNNSNRGCERTPVLGGKSFGLFHRIMHPCVAT